MDLRLKGKTALVTGSTAGIGLAIAERLAAEGVEVVVTGRSQDKLDAAVARVSKSGRARGVLADAGTAEGADALIAAVPSVDILVNNLGIYEAKPFTEISDADWLRLFEVNVMSGVRLSRHYFPKMIAANWGRVIFISSESGLLPPGEMIHYGSWRSRAAWPNKPVVPASRSTRSCPVRRVRRGSSTSSALWSTIRTRPKPSSRPNSSPSSGRCR
jgi:NAD(P)-dependent dehydrogenase (short-subunit alcohol dehydrogenase family)